MSPIWGMLPHRRVSETAMKQFHAFRLDIPDESLWRGQDRISLTPKSFSLLAYLVEHAGSLVPQSELFETLWPDTFVQPEVLKSHIRDLRSVLGDDARNPRFIETCHRRGYRFIAPVQNSDSHEKPAAISAPTLVGRREGLDALNEALQEARDGRPQLVFITGEVGIGKTTLLNAFESDTLRSFSNGVILRGQCVEGFGGREPYYPILEALSMLLRMPGWEDVVDVLAQHAPTWLAQFPAKVQKDNREALSREIAGATTERMLREFFEATEILAQDKPLVILLEDIHWADNYTVDWLSAFARGRRTAKLMVAATLRKLELVLTEHPLRELKEKLLAYRLCREIGVRPLSEPEVHVFLERKMLNNTIPDGLAEFLYRHSDGNPLFLGAALEQLIADGLVAHEDHCLVVKKPLSEISTIVPETLRQMIGAHIDSHLQTIEREVLEAASSCGLTFSAVLAAAAAEAVPEDIEMVCTRLAQRSHIIRAARDVEYPDGTVSSQFEFVHGLYCQIFYQRLGHRARERLHKNIGLKLQSLCQDWQEEVAPVLAYHFEKASAWNMVPQYLLATARMECNRFAFDAAILALKRTQRVLLRLPVAERGALQTDISFQIARCYAAKDEFARAGEVLEEAEKSLAQQNDFKRRPRLLLRLAYILSRIDANRCVSAAQRALEVALQGHDPSSMAEAKAGAIFWKLACDGWDAQASDLFARVLESMRTGPDKVVYGVGLVWDAVLNFLSSRYHDGILSIQGATRLLEGSDIFMARDTPRAEMGLRLMSGELGIALANTHAALQSAKKDGNRIREYLYEVLTAWIFSETLNWEGCAEICARISPHLDSPDTMSIRKVCTLFAGAAEAKLGRFQIAHRHFAEVSSLMSKQPTWMDWYWKLLLLNAEAVMHLDARDGKACEASKTFLTAALATEEKTYQALAWNCNARAAHAEHDTSYARQCIAHALEIVEGRDLPLAHWRVHKSAMSLLPESAALHRSKSAEAVRRLAASLVDFPEFRSKFRASEEVRDLL